MHLDIEVWLHPEYTKEEEKTLSEEFRSKLRVVITTTIPSMKPKFGPNRQSILKVVRRNDVIQSWLISSFTNL